MFAAALAVSLASTGAPAADNAALMIVVDGSGSMAGLLEPKGRQAKINLVRDSVRAALAAADAQSRIGLAAFGHRHGGCNDLEILRAPAPSEGERTAALLARIKPRGRGPLAFAVREAAKQLPEDATPRSVLLIHDSADNCQQDLCAAAAELRSAGITAHVVSLGTSAEDLGKVACLAHATGGRHLKVDSTEQAAAAITEVVRLASGELAAIGLAVPIPEAPWSTATIAPAPIPSTGPAALHLKALMTSGSGVASTPLHWTVAREDEPDMVVFDAWAANPVVPVAPGRYIVAARSDLVSASQTVTVREGRPTAVPLVLGAGAMRVRVAAQKTNAPLDDAIITVGTSAGAPLAVFKSAEAAALLPPGPFRVSAELGLVRSEQNVNVMEGRTTPVDITLNVGRLQLIAASRDGLTAVEPPLFIVMEDDPPRGRREVARSAASQAEFVLPPGTYYVIARQGSIEARERLEIGSGDVVRRALSAATGRLGLSSSGSRVLALVEERPFESGERRSEIDR
jgi:Ca-activated chloride channel family protein